MSPILTPLNFFGVPDHPLAARTVFLFVMKAVTQSPLREERSHHSKLFKDIQSYSKGFRKKMMRHLKIQSAEPPRP
jgi:hypothetical protein